MKAQLPLVAVLAAALALAGCSAPSAQTGSDEGTTQQQPDQGSDGNSSPDPNEGVPTDIPANWPAEVPIPSGEVLGAIDLGTGWAATVKVADPAAEFAKSAATLKSAGFTVLQESEGDAGSFGAYENDALQVQITTIPEGQQDGPSWHATIVKKG